MKTRMMLWLVAFALLQLPVGAAEVPTIYQYEWIGGQPGFSGRILLNAPTSAAAPDGGSDADVLPGSYVTTPLGTFSILDIGLDTAFDPPGNAVIWDETHVIYMNLFFDPVSPINNPVYGLPAIGNALANGFSPPNNAVQVGSLAGGFATAYAEDDYTGQWLAVPVPEPSTVAIILVMGAMAVCLSFTRRVSFHKL